MAILLEYGNNEGFTYNPRFLADMDYIQKRFGLHEMGMVEPEFVNCLKKYVVELQEYQESHKGNEKDAAHPLSSIAPDWAPELLKARYNMKFIG